MPTANHLSCSATLRVKSLVIQALLTFLIAGLVGNVRHLLGI
jgi:hypothetical protein